MMHREGKTLQIAGRTIKVGYEGPVKPWTKKLQKIALVGGLAIWSISSLVNGGQAVSNNSATSSPAMIQWAGTLKNDIGQCNTDYNQMTKDMNADVDNATASDDLGAVRYSCSVASGKIENLTIPKSLSQNEDVRYITNLANTGTKNAAMFVTAFILVYQGQTSLTGDMQAAQVKALGVGIATQHLDTILANQ